MSLAPRSTQYRFIEPLDVLFLRGNQLFGDPGSYGEALMPPWPSVAAGAIRSRILIDDGVDCAAFSQGAILHSGLGSPTQPGSFVLQAFHLACEHRNGGHSHSSQASTKNKGQKNKKNEKNIEILVAAPADLVIHTHLDGTGNDTTRMRAQARALNPTVLHSSLACSGALTLLPVLAQPERGKAAGGWWLTQAGWHQYLQGKIPASSELIHSGGLWSIDERVGVGLSASTRSAEEGKLFTSRAVLLKPDIGFVVAIAMTGAAVPSRGLLRLGGDGRAAHICPAAIDWPQPNYQELARQGRCRIVLTSPGLFTQGWLAHGITRTDADGSYRFDLHGVRGRLVAATVARSDVVSGWDLAHKQPKPAQRMAPTGSVYWLDELEATPDTLRKLVTEGLWGTSCEDAIRRAEGFNRLALAAWSEGSGDLVLKNHSKNNKK